MKVECAAFAPTPAIISIHARQLGSRYLDAFDTRLGSSKEGTAVDFVDSTAAEFIGRLFN